MTTRWLRSAEEVTDAFDALREVLEDDRLHHEPTEEGGFGKADCAACSALTTLTYLQMDALAIRALDEHQEWERAEMWRRKANLLYDSLHETVACLEIWEKSVGEINVWPMRCRAAIAMARVRLRRFKPRATEQRAKMQSGA